MAFRVGLARMVAGLWATLVGLAFAVAASAGYGSYTVPGTIVGFAWMIVGGVAVVLGWHRMVREDGKPVPPDREGISSPPDPMSKHEAIERMNEALEAAKRAREKGRDVTEVRQLLKSARVAFEGQHWEEAVGLCDEIIRTLPMEVQRTSTP